MLFTDEAEHPALLLVDGVSSVGAIDFRMDDWRVDVALTGSQKALSLPTGLGIVCASPKALEASKSAKSTRGYFDWREYLECYKVGTYWPYTPSVQMLYGLRASLDLILEVEGLDTVIARHLRLAEATRYLFLNTTSDLKDAESRLAEVSDLTAIIALLSSLWIDFKCREAVKAWGLTVCAETEVGSAVVTGVVVVPWLNSNDVIKIAWKKYNLNLGVGLGKLLERSFASDILDI